MAFQLPNFLKLPRTSRFLQLPRTVPLEAVAPFDPKPLEGLISEVDADVAANSKYTKLEAGYVPVPVIPPIYWDYRCEQCRQFIRF